MEQKTIKVVVKKPNELGEIKVIENTNEAYKEIIGAEYLDYTLYYSNLIDNPIDIIVDDFGIKKELKANFELKGFNIYGTVIFVERDNEGYFVDLSESSIEYLKSKNML